jgi:hypothetical protein
METHNVSIYHCVTCGRIVHAELETAAPQCCGHAMTQASEDTLHKGESAAETPGGQSTTQPPITRSEKPR